MIRIGLLVLTIHSEYVPPTLNRKLTANEAGPLDVARFHPYAWHPAVRGVAVWPFRSRRPLRPPALGFGCCRQLRSRPRAAADARRYQAMIDADAAMLETLLHEQFYYTHFWLE